jgi:hypothetical protein
MKTNTDNYSSLYYKPRAHKSRVKALLNGSALPSDVIDLVSTIYGHVLENNDEVAAFYVLELCEAVNRHLAD